MPQRPRSATGIVPGAATAGAGAAAAGAGAGAAGGGAGCLASPPVSAVSSGAGAGALHADNAVAAFDLGQIARTLQLAPACQS